MPTSGPNKTADPDQTGPLVPAPRRFASRPGRVRPMMLLWALGIPLPIVLVIMLIRGCV